MAAMANTICSLSDLDALNDAIPVAAWAVTISCEATETLVSSPPPPPPRLSRYAAGRNMLTRQCRLAT